MAFSRQCEPAAPVGSCEQSWTASRPEQVVAVALGPKEFLHGTIHLVYRRIRVSRGARIELAIVIRPKGARPITCGRAPSGQSGSKELPNGGTISKIRIGIQWDVRQRWDTISY
jgi:hypothetical protein